MNESLSMEQGEAVLLSIHPRHAQKILSGEKKLEFRRTWATRNVSMMVIYVTAPVKKIVGVATVKEVHSGSPDVLWKLARRIGGGLGKEELLNYFHDRQEGFAIEINSVQQFSPALDPQALIKGFKPPQSFIYLKDKSIAKLALLLEKEKSKGKIVFVAGVHGVGKTTLCQSFSQENKTEHRSASQLIRQEKEAAIASIGKAVKNIAGNQKILIAAVQKIRESGKALLLDGHFALLDTQRQPQALSKDVFLGLGIGAVVAIRDNSKNIAKRLEQRDGEAISSKEINELQCLELSQAEKICNELCIPFRMVEAFDHISFNKEVAKFC